MTTAPPTPTPSRSSVPTPGGVLPLLSMFLPPALRRAHRPMRILERHWFVGKTSFLWIILGGFFEPFFFLISTDLGFGGLIADIDVDGTLVPYVEFVAPALLAASAMNGAMYETMNVFFRIHFDKTYESMLATPVTVGDVVIGDVLWATLRGGLYAVAFMGVMAAMGMTPSWWGLLMLPGSLLIALAFGGIGLTIATMLRSIEDFEYVPTASLPLFLFSATFFPVSAYGDLGWIVNLSPLYHGVALLRALNLGQLSWGLLGHVAVLFAIALVGVTIAASRIERTLLT